MNAVQESPIDVLAVLREYVRGKADGETLDYVTISRETGLDMSARSGLRPVLCRALRRERMEYKVIRDAGVRISSAQNANDFVSDDVLAIAKKSKRARKRAARLLGKHSDDMSEPDKRSLLAVGAFHGTIELAVTAALAAKALPVTTEKPPPPVLPVRLRTI